MRLIDADAVVTIQTYDDMYEEWGSETMTVAEAMDKFSDEGCPPTVDAEPVITGDTSDGYHTFNELYHHRAVLFSVIVKAFPDNAWKAKKHHDGSMFDGMFIVGIETPEGQATYHYDIDPYWDMFRCKEVEFAPEWDGHTPQQAIERIGKLEPVRHAGLKETGFDEAWCNWGDCTKCGTSNIFGSKYCNECGAKMDGGAK